MSLADQSTFNYGGMTFPLTTTSSNTLLQDGDPVRYWALQFFASVLTTYMGDRLMQEARAAGLTAATMSAPVAMMTPLDPIPWLLEEHFTFPLLALYRISGKNSYRTLNWSHQTTKFGIAYVLPPLTAGQAEAIEPILASVPLILANRTELGSDPSFQNGALLWSGAFSGVEDIEAPIEGSYGAFPGLGNLMFPAWTGTMVVNERQMRETNFSKLLGVDAALDLATTGQGTIPDFVDFASDVVKPGPATG